MIIFSFLGNMENLSLGTSLSWTLMPHSHIGETAESAGATANKAATNKITKYNILSTTHFIQIAIETGCPWKIRSVGIHL